MQNSRSKIQDSSQDSRFNCLASIMSCLANMTRKACLTSSSLLPPVFPTDTLGVISPENNRDVRWVYNYVFISLYHYIIILLYYYTITLLYYYIIILFIVYCSLFIIYLFSYYSLFIVIILRGVTWPRDHRISSPTSKWARRHTLFRGTTSYLGCCCCYRFYCHSFFDEDVPSSAIGIRNHLGEGGIPG